MGPRVVERRRTTIELDGAWTGGIKVEKAAATLPQTGDVTLFTVTGRVILMAIVGEVTVVIETQANNTKLKYNPDDSATDTDLCAVLDISADVVGILYSITGVVGDALIEGIQQVIVPTTFHILKSGLIELDCSAGNTGETKWTLWYIPLDSGSKVV